MRRVLGVEEMGYMYEEEGGIRDDYLYQIYISGLQTRTIQRLRTDILSKHRTAFGTILI
jgi:hypothetical protein